MNAVKKEDNNEEGKKASREVRNCGGSGDEVSSREPGKGSKTGG